MSKQSGYTWQNMMTDWQKNQASVTQSMVDAFSHLSTSFNQPQHFQSNPFLNNYQNMQQGFLDYYKPWLDNLNTEGVYKTLSEMPGMENAQELIKAGSTLFEHMSKDYFKQTEDDGSQAYLFKALSEMTSPNQWIKSSGNLFDLTAHKLSEGPFFSGISDFDQRMAKLSDDWKELMSSSQQYQAVVMESWTQAYALYIERAKEQQSQTQQPLSPKELITLWSNITNDELMSLHRSEEYLNAQKAVIKASMNYRLSEKEIAQEFCEAMHIPTRSEIDDLHLTVTELKREIRKLKAEKQKVAAKKPAAKKRVASKKTPAKAAAKKTASKAKPKAS